MYRRSLFDRFSKAVAHFAGHPMAFPAAVLLIGLWIVSGPAFGFSDTWQLVINTATTIVTSSWSSSFRKKYVQLAEEARNDARGRRRDTGTPDIELE